MSCFKIKKERHAAEDEEEKSNLVNAVLTPPWKLTPQQIKLLPPNYFQRLDAGDLQSIWKHIPKEYRKNKKLQLKLPCYDHWNRPEDRDHIDGPPPARDKCWECQKHK